MSQDNNTNFNNHNNIKLQAKSYPFDKLRAGKQKASLGFTPLETPRLTERISESKLLYRNKKFLTGFTLMEIIVSTTIFAFVVTALLSMFNYTLKINRRSEALRQATQGMRNFVEYLVKEIRNGEIDYGIINGSTYTSAWPAIPPYCGLALPGPAGTSVAGSAASTYSMSGGKSNKIAIINSEGEQKCFYFGTSGGTSPAGDGVFYQANGTIAEETISGFRQILNPPNFRVENLMFIIRPTCDPYTICADYGNSYPKTQPVVELMMKFVTELPTKEKVIINYQTTVSLNKYDIPNQ